MPRNDRREDLSGSRTPRRVQWAQKNKVEHFELVRLRDEDHDDHPHTRKLDEHARDPEAFAKLHEALESYLRAPSSSKPAPRAKNIPRLKDAFFSVTSEDRCRGESSRQGALRGGTKTLAYEVYVDPSETAGVPLPMSCNRLQIGHELEQDLVEEHGKKQKSHWEKRARQMMHAMHWGRGNSHSELLISSWKEKEKEKERERQPERVVNLDVEADLQGHIRYIEPLPLGRDHGILSTLLSVYQHQMSASSSTTNLVDPTPGETDVESVRTSDSHDSTEMDPDSRYFESSASHLNRSGPILQEAQADSDYSESGSESYAGKRKCQFPRDLYRGSHPLLLLSTGPPKAAQSSAGVIGTLIATANSLAGPAAPVHSSIGPNVSKKGFRLSRYHLNPDAQSSRASSGPPTPPGTPASESGASQTSSIYTIKRPTWLTEVSPADRLSMKAGKQSLIYGAEGEACKKGKYKGKSYRKAKKTGRKATEIYITKHVAEVLQRQEFILKLARALMMFAGPSHRLQSQLRATARVLDLELSTLLLPNVILVSFGDPITSTSNIKFIQQSGALDLEKLLLTHKLYWKVIHDEISVSSASGSLDLLMHSPPRYRNWQVIIFGGLCSSTICTLAFSGSFADSLVVFPLGCLLVIVQMMTIRNELYSNVFEITIATLLSFISAAIATGRQFCYAAIASSSVVLILPGFIVLTGSLELAARQITSGAVRICFAIIYSLFLGFGLAMGAQIYSVITGLQVVGPDDFTCNTAHQPTDPWWHRRASLWWAFLTVPLFSLALSLRNYSPMWRKEMIFIIIIACGGWTANHFSGNAFKNRPDIQSAIGAFAVGIAANLYGRFFYGNAYVVMITGILFQLPSGLAQGGLLRFAAVDGNQNNQFQSYEAGFRVAAQLVAVAIGLTVGLFVSVVIVHPLGGGKKREGGLFSL